MSNASIGENIFCIRIICILLQRQMHEEVRGNLNLKIKFSLELVISFLMVYCFFYQFNIIKVQDSVSGAVA